jgi:hypothetical protein
MAKGARLAQTMGEAIETGRSDSKSASIEKGQVVRNPGAAVQRFFEERTPLSRFCNSV